MERRAIDNLSQRFPLGRGTFDRVMRGWELLRKDGGRRERRLHGACGQPGSAARRVSLLPRHPRRRVPPWLGVSGPSYRRYGGPRTAQIGRYVTVGL